MTDHHLKLNLGKTELLFLPGKDCPFHDLAITVDNSIVSSSQSAKNLGVILDNTLSFSTNIKAVARSCRFMLYNIRRVQPCLTQEAAQVLIQALVISRLDYCNSLLAGLPACAIKPLQLIQNAAARLVFNLPKFSHVTPLLRSLHWLPVEARIRYKTMVLRRSLQNAKDFIRSIGECWRSGCCRLVRLLRLRWIIGFPPLNRIAMLSTGFPGFFRPQPDRHVFSSQLDRRAPMPQLACQAPMPLPVRRDFTLSWLVKYPYLGRPVGLPQVGC
ncbi:uncharacterized protein LOC127911472 [Oncorhynchus keta]|uniref:uncharacterized protein LOC127911472 n=1 Tax=Oncorhynchus keta TaxID=8018 RepID=UPI00227D04B2|nr:uncharacterized protein LOC127911472 [Oncorhynchus keta]